MKISCEIIEDLLPLYIDEVCSEESKKMVEDHLCECSACKKKLDEMKKNFLEDETIMNNIKEAKPIRNLSEKWNRELFVERIKGIFSTLVIVGLVILITYIFVGIKIG